MAGLCGVVEWAMEGAYAHLVSTPGVLGFALSLSCKCTCCFRLWEYLRRLGCLFSVVGFELFFFVFFWGTKGGWFLGVWLLVSGVFGFTSPQVGFSYSFGF